MMHSPLLRLSVALFCLAGLRAESAVQHLLEDKLHARLQELDGKLAGVVGVATIDLTSGRIFVYNGEAVFPTASTIKIPIMAQMFRERIDLNQRVTVDPKDAVGGAGHLQEKLKSGPVTLSVRELMTAMIIDSDNTATNRCIALAGKDRVNKMLADLGFRATRLRRLMMDGAAAARGDENTTTPLEMARIVEMLYRNRLTPAGDTAQMLDVLKRVKADIRRVVPAEIEVASKPGDLNAVHCESAIVYLPGRPFVVAIYSTFLGGDANPVPDAARMVFDYFRQLAESNEYGNKVK